MRAAISTNDQRTTGRLNGWLLFGSLCVVYLVISYFAREYVMTDAVYYRSLSDQLSTEHIRSYLDLQESWSWIGYALTPALLALKMAFTAFCLAVGFVLLDTFEIGFRELFKTAMLAEGVFVLASLFHLAWIEWAMQDITLESLAAAYPLSMLAFVDASDLPRWARYPLQTANLFELLYCTALGYLLAWRRVERVDEMFVLSLSSYGTGLLLWVAFVSFMTLQVT